MTINFDLRHDAATLGQVIEYLQQREAEVKGQGRDTLASELRLICIQLEDALEDILNDMNREAEMFEDLCDDPDKVA